MTDPCISGRYTALVPVSQAHVPFLYRLLLEQSYGFGWKFRGATPSLERFAAEFGNGIFSHFVVCDLATGASVGYVGGYECDLRAGHCRLLIDVSMGVKYGPISVDAALGFMDYLFWHWPLRKFFIERPTFIGRRRALDRFCTLEGCLKDYVFADGTYHDMELYSMSREQHRGILERYGFHYSMSGGQEMLVKSGVVITTGDGEEPVRG
jgi:hypothetical protein